MPLHSQKFLSFFPLFIFSENLDFFNSHISLEFVEIWDFINSTSTFVFLHFVLIFNIRLTRFSVGFLKGHQGKSYVAQFFRGDLASLAAVSVCQTSFRTEDS